MTWRWLRQDVAVAVHNEQIAEYGGGAGLRDAGLLSSALARPQHKVADRKPSVFDLAAAYAAGIILNHPFVDGNKRTGFLAAYVFLDLNGWNMVASEVEAVSALLALALREIDEDDFANWLKEHAVQKPST